jgi:Pyrimidine dimer DNA glycosylase
MNIFVTSPCPRQSAKYLDNKRKIKMCLESTQMLCTALNVHGVETPYKTAHLNHPCSIWVRQSKQNFLWLWEHALELSDEYTRIYGKVHACKAILTQIKQSGDVLPDIGLTPFANCARAKDLGIDFTSETDIYLAYQSYLNKRWENDKRTPEWG